MEGSFPARCGFKTARSGLNCKTPIRMVTSFSGRLVFLEGRKKVLLFVSFRARKASKDSVDVGFFPFIEGTLLN